MLNGPSNFLYSHSLIDAAYAAAKDPASGLSVKLQSETELQKGRQVVVRKHSIVVDTATGERVERAECERRLQPYATAPMSKRYRPLPFILRSQQPVDIAKIAHDMRRRIKVATGTETMLFGQQRGLL